MIRLSRFNLLISTLMCMQAVAASGSANSPVIAVTPASKPASIYAVTQAQGTARTAQGPRTAAPASRL